MEHSTRILESSVAVEQGMRVRVGCYSGIQGIKYQRIVVAVPGDIGYDFPVIQVQISAEVSLVNLWACVVFEFCYIRFPLVIRMIRVELTVQIVFRNVLGICCLSGAASCFCT